MKRLLRLAIVFGTIFIGAATAFAQSDDAGEPTAEEKAKTLAALQRVVPLIRASKLIAENYAMCPLKRGRSRDLAIKLGSWFAGDEPEELDCSLIVNECWEACEANVDWACRNLANTAEGFSEQIGEDIDRRLYAHGCALGDANACTNRAAGIVNDIRSIDPVEPLDDAKRAQCTITMYEDACDEDEYWGCTQVSIERGEDGHPSIRDEMKAVAAFRKACQIDAKDEGNDPSGC